MNTLCDKLRAIVKDCRDVLRGNEVTSGIAEEVNEIDRILGDIIDENNDLEKRKTKDKKK